VDAQKTFTAYGAPIRDAGLLPVQPPKQIIGRNRELGSMHNTLKIGAPIFLSGISGIGKSATAAVLATAHIAANPTGGVLWFNVLEDDLEQLAGRVARAYGEQGPTEPATDYAILDQHLKLARSLLEKHKPLIVLDGMIDVDAARDFVKLCAAGIPLVIINDTSASGPWTPVELNPLTLEDSQKLFVQNSNLTDPLYAADIEGLCKFLNGIPLAIDLAARLCGVDDMTPAELLSSLPPMSSNETPQMMVSLTFKRLAPSVQAMLIVLGAMFTGTATAELISDVSDVPAANVVPLMQQLAMRGLVSPSAIYGQYAYTLHDTAQAYIHGWLEQYQRLQATENRALKAVLKYLARHTANNVGLDTAHQDRLAAEMPNIVGAAAFATASAQTSAVRTLIDTLKQNAGDFIQRRGFGLELDQMNKLMSLLVQPSAPTSSAESPAFELTQPIQSTAAMPPVPPDVPEGLPDSGITQPSPAQSIFDEPTYDTEATPAVGITVPNSSKPDTLPPSDIISDEPPLIFGDTQTSEQTPPHAIPAMDVPDLPESELFTPVGDETQPAVESEDVDLFDTAQISHTQPQPAATVHDDYDQALDQPFGDTPDDTPEAASSPIVIDEPPRTLEDTAIPTEHSLPTVEKRLVNAREMGDKATEAKLLYALGRYYALKNDRLLALGHQKQALDLYESLEDTDGMLVTLEALAEITAQADDAEGSVLYATRGVNLARKLSDKVRLGRLLMRLADVRLALGDAQAAIDTYGEAAEILRMTEDWFSIGVVMSKLGNAYVEQRMFNEAIMMLEQSLVIFQKEQRNDYVGRVLGNIGAAYNGLQRWDKAREYFRQALVISRQQDDRHAEAATLAALGIISRIQDNRDGAIDYFRQALHVANLMGDVDLQSEYSYELGSMLIEHPSTIQMGQQLLRESDALVPRSEARQLINRASKRVDRARNAGMDLPAPESSSGDYASKAYRWNVD
jgi:tetratricopeptide (TPR) repeat protein